MRPDMPNEAEYLEGRIYLVGGVPWLQQPAAGDLQQIPRNWALVTRTLSLWRS